MARAAGKRFPPRRDDTATLAFTASAVLHLLWRPEAERCGRLRFSPAHTYTEENAVSAPRLYFCACGAGPFRISRALGKVSGVCCYKCAFTTPADTRKP